MSHNAVEWSPAEMSMATGSETLRSQATRLLCQAVDARSKGNQEVADLLTNAAARCLEQATSVELADPLHQPPIAEQPQQCQPHKQDTVGDHRNVTNRP
jgi:hypothetical protein